VAQAQGDRDAGADVGLAGLDTNNLMPADFLIDEEGRIVEAYYGGDAGDRIPLERVELFLARGLIERSGRMAQDGATAAGSTAVSSRQWA
jgi:hypothetical protein